MIHALIWLPLLALFSYLAWAGWNDYHKVQAYGEWAREFQNAKYDMLCVLARQENRLVWGRPTPIGPVELQEVSLTDVRDIQLVTDGKVADPLNPPRRARQVGLCLYLDNDIQVSIPFTETALAARWQQFLQPHVLR